MLFLLQRRLLPPTKLIYSNPPVGQLHIRDMATMASGEVLTVHRGWKDTGKHVWSPFVIKLEARLRFGGLAYRTAGGSPKTAPRGKIPYVEFSPSPQQGDALGDSGLIIRALTERGLLPDLNARLGGEERARDLAVRAMLEDRLCFYHVSKADFFSCEAT